MAAFTLSDGVTIWYEELGKGQPLVLIPGWAMSGAFFRKQLDDLSQEYRVIAIDQRGQGNSGGKDGVLPTITLLAHDLGEFLAGLDLHQVVLCGWSMGALVAWSYCGQFGTDRLSGLIILEMAVHLGTSDPSDWVAPEDRALEHDPAGYLRSFVAAMFVQPPQGDVLDFMVEEALKTPVRIAQQLNEEMGSTDVRPLLPHIEVPTLIVYGATPLFSTKEQQEETVRLTRNPRVIVMPESKHCPFWEEPVGVNEEIRQFIRSLSVQKSATT